MSFKFPFTNYHELNLTWVLDQLKKLFEESAENVTTIQNYDGRLTAVETELPTVSETASEASRSAAAAGTLAQSAKATADSAQKNAVQAQSLAGTARQEAQAAQRAADAATQAAQQAQATAQNFDGRITQAENDASQALEASRSFENRVQSAITTANNAARTATDAQGVAQNANQNAAAALDKIGNLSDLTTEATQNLVAAINEIAQSGGGGGSGAVTSVNGKTGQVVLTAEDIGYNNTTVADELNDIDDKIFNFNIGNDLFITKEVQSDRPITKESTPIMLTAPIIDGYTFLLWKGGVTVNYNGYCAPSGATVKNCNFYGSSTSAGENKYISGVALYVKTDYKDLFLIDSISSTFQSARASVSAPEREGYDFFCWPIVISYGFIGQCYAYFPTNENTPVWCQGASNGSTCKAYALYIKNGYKTNYFTIEKFDVPATTERIEITAPDITGFKFLFWLAAITCEYVGRIDMDSLTEATTNIKNIGTDPVNGAYFTFYYIMQYNSSVQPEIPAIVEDKLQRTQSMIATVETEITASRDYAINEFLVYNGQLYKVTTAITTGETITPGTNCSITTVAEQLSLLFNALRN